MESVILGLLLIRPMTVYEINSAFKRGISLFFSASYGGIQAALKKLINTGRIVYSESVESGRHKKTYTPTLLGRTAFFEWIEAPIPGGKLEVNILSKIYFMGLVENPNTRKKILLDIKENIESSLQRLDLIGTEEREKIREGRQMEVATFQMMILDYGTISMNAARGWIEEMLKNLPSP